MKIHNSSPLSRATLRAFVSFIVKRSPNSVLAKVSVEMGQQQRTTGGIAFLEDPHRAYDPSAPSLVEILTSDPMSFIPHDEKYVDILEGIRVETWEEEVFLTLAHELRHIAQFWPEKSDPTLDAYMMEVDAEAFAIQTLAEWRISRPSKLAA